MYSNYLSYRNKINRPIYKATVKDRNDFAILMYHSPKLYECLPPTRNFHMNVEIFIIIECLAKLCR